LLASRSGDLVTREEIQQEIWSEDEIVDFDQGLNFCIRQIRSALSDNADVPRFVETVPRRGYRFIAPVQTSGVSSTAATPVVELPSTSEESVAAPRTPERHVPKRRLIGLTVMVAVALGLAALIIAYRRSADQPARGATIRSLAVLPLTNLSGNSAQQFFTDGMTEAIIDHLSALQGVRVIANFRYAVRGNS
jgi:DNA-binding winged helix-turn-helix (wHTH) protein